jgi:hypothetical protein
MAPFDLCPVPSSALAGFSSCATADMGRKRAKTTAGESGLKYMPASSNSAQAENPMQPLPVPGVVRPETSIRKL